MQSCHLANNELQQFLPAIVFARTRHRFYTNASKQEPIVYSMHEVDNVFSDTLHGDSFEEYPEYISLQASSVVF